MVAFAYGLLPLPFVRSVFPYNLKLPAIDADSQCWQQSDTAFQQVDDQGNWQRQTQGTIQDSAVGNITHTTPAAYQLQVSPIWIGTPKQNLLLLLMGQMAAIKSALGILSTHTHNGGTPNDQGAAVATQSAIVGNHKSTIDGFTSSPE